MRPRKNKLMNVNLFFCSNKNEKKYLVLTSYNNGMYELIIKKSRFVSKSFDLNNKKDFEIELEKYKEIFPDARHIVYAYIIEDGRAGGSSDDGEPKGTAGKAIFNLLRLKKVENKAIIVARYFGGKKLGASGLIRAYVDAAKNVL